MTHAFLPSALLLSSQASNCTPLLWAHSFQTEIIGAPPNPTRRTAKKKHVLHPTCKCNLIKSVHGSVGCAVARPHPLSVLVELTLGRTYKICTCVRPCETLGPGHRQTRVILPMTNGMSTTHVRYAYVLAWQLLPLMQLEFVPDSKTEYQSFFSQRPRKRRYID